MTDELSTAIDQGPGSFSRLVEKEWQDLLDKSDRTSPAEYPDMCLITHNEISGVMAEAWLLGREQAGRNEGRTQPVSNFEVGSHVQPRGGGLVVGEILEFNEPQTGALVRWNTGEEIWKALRTLEVVPPQPVASGQGKKPTHDQACDYAESSNDPLAAELRSAAQSLEQRDFVKADLHLHAARLIDATRSIAAPLPQGETPICATCNGRGEIGGWVGGVASIDGGGGYETSPCPDCTPTNRPCTCPPLERPRTCQRKFALAECWTSARAAAPPPPEQNAVEAQDSQRIQAYEQPPEARVDPASSASTPPLRAIHYEEPDFLEYVPKDVPTVVQPVQAGVDLVLDMKTREPIGWRIYGWSRKAPTPSPTVALREALEFITKYFEPWGSWKTAWWEGEVGDQKQFNDANALRHVQRLLSASPAAETILTAAISSEGVIVTVERPRRHGSCINFLHRHDCEYREGQGFLTSAGRFVDRAEGWRIAEAAGQILAPYPGRSTRSAGLLFSEDVWAEPASPAGGVGSSGSVGSRAEARTPSRAAIAAMREPTEVMLSASEFYATGASREDVVADFTAMIDSILNTNPEGRG